MSRAETAAARLVKTYNKHKIRVTHTKRERIKWITLLPKIIEHATDQLWPELSDFGLEKTIERWNADLAKDNFDSIPTTDRVSKGQNISPLVARSYEFFKFFVQNVEREVHDEIADDGIKHDTLSKHHKLRKPRREEPHEALVIKEIVKKCLALSQGAWESSRVTSEMREHVFLLVGARADPTVAIDAIRQATGASSHSLGRRRRGAPIGIRQRSMYFPDRQI